MSEKNRGVLLMAIGAIPLAIAVIKLWGIGYYPNELPLYLGLLVGGMALAGWGNRIYNKAKQEQPQTVDRGE